MEAGLSWMDPSTGWMAAKAIRNRDQSFYPTVSISLDRREVPQLFEGVYVFAVDKWSVGGLREIEKLHFSAIHLKQKEEPLPANEAERLVTRAAQSGSDWHAVGDAVDLDNAADVAELLLEVAESAYNDFINQMKDENHDRADIQQESARAHLATQEETLLRVAAGHRENGREPLAVATEGKLEKLRNRVNERLSAIEESRDITYRHKEATLGVIRVTESATAEE